MYVVFECVVYVELGFVLLSYGVEIVLLFVKYVLMFLFV